MTRILITGGLGYIGQELCYLYSGETEKYDITVLDINFFAERNSRISQWGFKFLQGSILDKELMERIVPTFDIIYHLAGITNVAYTKSEDNKLDSNITEVGIQGTRNILNNMNNSSKIIFPSTHVVFEGYNEVKLNLTEESNTTPILTYSKSKYKSEEDIVSSNKKYIICRLASVYGFSYDSTRIGIMPNLFTKMSSTGQTIKLFSDGVQMKSLVSVKDVVRFMKFISHSDIINEVYHVSNENISVGGVAKILKEIDPKIKVIKTKDEIPNLGYTISNKKMLSTGFQLKSDLESSLIEMYSKWTQLRSNDKDEYIQKGTDIYKDKRGIISNYELSEPINLIGYIESKKGTIRANHFHPIQEQKCLLIKGQYISVTKNLYKKNSNLETRLINKGDLAVIKPNVAHTMVFTEDSIFLNLVNGERKHENYGITHTIPYNLVSETFRDDLIEGYSRKCRVCDMNDFKEIVSLGLSPLANNLEKSPNSTKSYPLEVIECNSCGNFQLSFNVNPSDLFLDYKYQSSVGESFKQHFKNAAKNYIDRFNLTSKSLVLDIGSNDGIGLIPFKDSLVKVIGVEPSKELCDISTSKGIFTINRFFDEETVNIILNQFGKPNLILASNVFAHINDLDKVFKNLFKVLSEKGTLIVEIQYQKTMFEKILFDNIYHEHYNYWTLNSFEKFSNKHNFYVNDCEEIQTHGGSLRLFISRNREQSKSLKNQLEIEKNDINDSLISNFQNKVLQNKSNFIKNLKILKEKYSLISGYGAPAKATTLLNFFNLTSDDIKCIYEDNPMKKDLFIPGTGIMIKSSKTLDINNEKLVIVFAWNFYDDIIIKNKELIEKGIRFVNVKDLMEPNFVLD